MKIFSLKLTPVLNLIIGIIGNLLRILTSLRLWFGQQVDFKDQVGLLFYSLAILLEIVIFSIRNMNLFRINSFLKSLLLVLILIGYDLDKTDLSLAQVVSLGVLRFHSSAYELYLDQTKQNWTNKFSQIFEHLSLISIITTFSYIQLTRQIINEISINEHIFLEIKGTFLAYLSIALLNFEFRLQILQKKENSKQETTDKIQIKSISESQNIIRHSGSFTDFLSIQNFINLVPKSCLLIKNQFEEFNSNRIFQETFQSIIFKTNSNYLKFLGQLIILDDEKPDQTEEIEAIRLRINTIQTNTFKSPVQNLKNQINDNQESKKIYDQNYSYQKTFHQYLQHSINNFEYNSINSQTITFQLDNESKNNNNRQQQLKARVQMIKVQYNMSILNLTLSIINKNGQTEIFILFDDITMLEQEKKQNSNNMFQSRILKSFSHELRTPLNYSLNIIQQEIKDTQIETQKNNLISIFYSNKQLLHTLNDIIDLASFDQGTMTFVHSNFSVEALIEQTKNYFRIPAKTKDIEFQIKIDPKIPTLIRNDEQRLQQILLNLLANSFKFTKSGKITLEAVWVEKASLDEMAPVNMIKFTIKDTGVGMSSEKVNKFKKLFERNMHQNQVVFSPIVKQNNDPQLSRSGFGIGLTISKLHSVGLSQMKKSIELASFESSGSSFSFFVFDFIQTDTWGCTLKLNVNSLDESELFILETVILKNNNKKNESLANNSETQQLKKIKKCSISNQNIPLVEENMQEEGSAEEGAQNKKEIREQQKQQKSIQIVSLHDIDNYKEALVSMRQIKSAQLYQQMKPRRKKEQTQALITPTILQRHLIQAQQQEQGHKKLQFRSENLQDSLIMEKGCEIPQPYETYTPTLMLKFDKKNQGGEDYKDILFEEGKQNEIRVFQDPDQNDLQRQNSEINDILIVDDNQFNVQCLKIVIENNGQQSDFCFSGEQALQIIELRLKFGHPYQLIFMDLDMPGLDGFETSQLVTELYHNYQIPKNTFNICCCSAFSDIESRLKAKQSGMGFFVAKPIESKELKDLFQAINLI